MSLLSTLSKISEVVTSLQALKTQLGFTSTTPLAGVLTGLKTLNADLESLVHGTSTTAVDTTDAGDTATTASNTTAAPDAPGR